MYRQVALGNDLSGGTHGVSQALSLSEGLTNLSTRTFGEYKRLAPLKPKWVRTWTVELESGYLRPIEAIIVKVTRAVAAADGRRVARAVDVQREDIARHLPVLRDCDARVVAAAASFAADRKSVV